MLGALERWVLRVGSGRRRGDAEAAEMTSPTGFWQHQKGEPVGTSPAQRCGRPCWEVAIGEGAEPVSSLRPR